MLYALPLHTSNEQAPALVELLAGAGYQCATWEDDDSGRATLSIYCQSESESAAAAAAIAEQLTAWTPLLTHPPAIGDVTPIPDCDWAESWKHHFHADHISRRVWVKPSWEEVAPGPDEVVVELDPGMSFGTGLHGTTRACLQFLDQAIADRPEATCIDVGCGSGILAIAAAKLGLKTVLAIDNDPEAVRIAAENARRNHADVIRFHAAPLGPPLPGRPRFDIVVANILADVLVEQSDALQQLLALHGVLILSGILTEQFDRVRDHFAARRFRCDARRTIDTWTSGLFRQPAPDA